jgi:TatD DNase family protein
MVAHQVEYGLCGPSLTRFSMWIDAHTHLFDLSADECAAQIEDARLCGVGVILSTATDHNNALTVERQCGDHPMIFGAVGISPFDVKTVPETWYTDLLRLLTNDKMIAVGEIGIDDTNPAYPPLSLQQPVFERHLDIAKQAGLPAVIHSRGAEERAVDICRSIGSTDVVFHCFTGSRAALAAVLDQGYYVSLSGILTFRNFELRNYIRDIPANRLLIETDCPYLAPVPHRGAPNRPAWVRYVGKEAARLLGMPEDAMALQIENNFRRLFRKCGFSGELPPFGAE